jgi:hypothetical protein
MRASDEHALPRRLLRPLRGARLRLRRPGVVLRERLGIARNRRDALGALSSETNARAHCYDPRAMPPPIWPDEQGRGRPLLFRRDQPEGGR